MDGGGDTPGMITDTFFLVTSFPKNVVLKPRSRSLCPQLFPKAFHFGEVIFRKQKNATEKMSWWSHLMTILRFSGHAHHQKRGLGRVQRGFEWPRAGYGQWPG